MARRDGAVACGSEPRNEQTRVRGWGVRGAVPVYGRVRPHAERRCATAGAAVAAARYSIRGAGRAVWAWRQRLAERARYLQCT